MIKEIEQIVEQACKSQANIFGYGIWTHHITLVVKNALQLAPILGGDKDVCELSALLHDYASIVNSGWYPEHHIHSARLAKEILTQYKYPTQVIEKVQECIRTHRGSQSLQPLTTEALILANGDAMEHIQAVDSLLYLAYVQHKMGIDEGQKWVIQKVERSWSKMVLQAQELVREKYEATRILFVNPGDKR